MLSFFTILHFLGASFLIGGEPLVALIAIKAEKDDSTLKFFVNFLSTIAVFMWIGMGLALAGGLGMFIIGSFSLNALFSLKLILYILVGLVSLLLLLRIPKVKLAARENLSSLRKNPDFKQMDLFSRINLLLVMAILIVSVLMY